jgi:fructose-1,6-bisphosphatase/inositol monophosphatase family enzyme
MNLPETLLEKTIEATKEAGQLLLDRFETDIEVGIKGKEEIVTEADRASEALLHDRLLKILPGSGFCGEETGYHPGSSGLIWVVDPLDGTHNYSEGVPLWACSVALLDEKRVPCLGVLDLPTLRKTLWAERGKGTYLLGKRLQVDTTPLASTSWIGLQSRIRLDPFPPHLERACFKYCGRSFGAIVHHAVLVATGHMRGCVDLSVKLHDIAAAMVIIEEAGGVCSNLDGGPVFPESYFTDPFEDGVLPFFAGDPVTGPGLLKYLFPEGTPSNVLESRTPKGG